MADNKISISKMVLLHFFVKMDYIMTFDCIFVSRPGCFQAIARVLAISKLGKFPAKDL